VSGWIVRVDAKFDFGAWTTGKPLAVLERVREWIFACRNDGPPVDTWLVEIESGYRYRYLLQDVGVTIEFLAVADERWVLIKVIH